MIDILTPEYLDEFERRQSGPVYAVPSFLPTLNKACGDDGGGRGLARGWFVVVAGNPGFGKSLLALLLARDSVQSRNRTAFVSLEMAHGQLAARFYAMATGQPIHGLEKGRFDEAVMIQVTKALRELFPTGGLLTNRDLLFSLADVLGEIERQADDGVTTFLVDYLQLVGLGDEDTINRQVTEAVTRLRAFALKREVLVVALSQFNRQTSANYKETPHIQGCHGGMIIEASTDVGLLIDHSRYKRDDDKSHIARTYLIVDKNRHGSRAAIPIEWDFRNLCCREGMPDEEHRWPRHESK